MPPQRSGKTTTFFVRLVTVSLDAAEVGAVVRRDRLPEATSPLDPDHEAIPGPRSCGAPRQSTGWHLLSSARPGRANQATPSATGDTRLVPGPDSEPLPPAACIRSMGADRETFMAGMRVGLRRRRCRPCRDRPQITIPRRFEASSPTPRCCVGGLLSIVSTHHNASAVDGRFAVAELVMAMHSSRGVGPLGTRPGRPFSHLGPLSVWPAGFPGPPQPLCGVENAASL